MDTETVERSPMEEARLRKGLTLRQLAAVISAAGTKVTDPTLSRIERGQKPRPELRQAIADALGMDPLQLP